MPPASHHETLCRLSLLVLVVSFFLFHLIACEEQPYQDIQIAAQDFRFQPSSFSLHAAEPIRITLVNEGRTMHEFTSRLFTDPQSQIHRIESPQSLSPEGVIQLKPGQHATITFQAAAGTYFFRCRVKGHKGMDGMVTLQ